MCIVECVSYITKKKKSVFEIHCGDVYWAISDSTTQRCIFEDSQLLTAGNRSQDHKQQNHLCYFNLLFLFFMYACLHKKAWLGIVKCMNQTRQLNRKCHTLSCFVITNGDHLFGQNCNLIYSFAVQYTFLWPNQPQYGIHTGPTNTTINLLDRSQFCFTCMFDRNSPRFEMIVGRMYCDDPGVEALPVGCWLYGPGVGAFPLAPPPLYIGV